MNNEQAQEYLVTGGSKCPYCASTNIEGGAGEFDIGVAFQEIRCLECGEEWQDNYTLSGVAFYPDGEYTEIQKESA